MPGEITLFVVDAGPLITLAAARSLDYLLYVDPDAATVVIPDAVFYEAAHDASKLGAADIIAWANENHRRVEIAPTNAYLIFDAARQVNPRLRQPNLGEQAAVEVIEQPSRLGPGERAVLLCEESAVLRRLRPRDPSVIVEVSTMDFLRILEEEQRIQSARAVFQLAVEAGRTPSRIERVAEHEEEIRRTIARLVRNARDPR